MNEDNLRRIIFSQLYVMRGQLDSILLMVEELEGKNDKSCKHPKDQRVSFTTMGGPEHWKCQLCGFEYIEGQMGEEQK